MKLSKLLVVLSIFVTFCLCNRDRRIHKYDFIIVGGGTSGLTLAWKLSENPNYTVLLLEAGPGPINDETWNNYSPNDWLYKTKDKNLVWHAGKGLGGTSELGNKIYTAGSVYDYNEWSKNNSGWSHEDVKKYFLKRDKNNKNQTKSAEQDLKIKETNITQAGTKNREQDLQIKDTNITPAGTKSREQDLQVKETNITQAGTKNREQDLQIKDTNITPAGTKSREQDLQIKDTNITQAGTKNREQDLQIKDTNITPAGTKSREQDLQVKETNITQAGTNSSEQDLQIKETNITQAGTKSTEQDLHLRLTKFTQAGNMFFKGMRELGYKKVPKSEKGFNFISTHYLSTYFQNNQQTTPSREIFQELQRRKNLVIMTESYAIKLKVNPFTRWARAVLFDKKGAVNVGYAAKEIILCAGVVGTSKMLLLSGIGPQKDLENLRIRTVVDLPVGKGVKDHVSFPGLSYVTNYKTDQKPIEVDRTNHTNGAEAIGYISLDRKEKTDRPDVEYLVFNQFLNNFDNYTGVSKEDKQKYFRATRLYGIHILPILLNPKSEGQITLKSKNWEDAPLIKPNYFKDEFDAETLAEGIMYVDNVLMHTKPFEKENAMLYPMSICPEETYKSKEYWKCAVKKIHMSMGDYMGGCPMGPRNGDSVVDNELRVHTLKNVRIADASVIPIAMAGHLEGPVLMIAMKAADLIKEKHNE